jgi:hypothetical protein
LPNLPVWQWNGTAWVQISGGGGGGSGAASGITFAPGGNISATDVQAAIVELDTEKAPIASPTLTGDPKAPTPTAGDNDTSIATTAFVAAAVTAAGSAAQVVRYDIAQTLTAAQQKQARANIAVNDDSVIINGDFRINQVGYVSAAVLAAGAYGHDQWKAGASGGDYSFTQLKSSTQITIAAGKSLIQPIEDANVVGGSYVLTWTGTAQARAGVNTLTPSGAYAASPLLVTGQTAGTVMSIEFNSGTLGAVKLESGASATPFIMRPYDQELLACQRYLYKRNYTTINIYVATLQAYTSAAAGGPLLDFPTSMRSSPSVTAGGAFSLTGASGNALALTGGTITATPDYSYLSSTVASGLVAGNSTLLMATTVPAFHQFDARL